MNKELTMDELDFLSKIGWEGGAVEAYFYGLHEKDLPTGKVKKKWKQFRLAMDKIAPLIEEINEMIDVEGD